MKAKVIKKYKSDILYWKLKSNDFGWTSMDQFCWDYGSDLHGTLQTHLFVEPEQRADNSDVSQTDSLPNQESASV